MNSDQLNPTPKAKFQKNEQHIKEHYDLLANPAFDRAEEATLLLYQRSLGSQLAAVGNQPQAQLQAMMNGVKLSAVQEFMHEFRTLAEKTIESKPPGIGRRLDHAN